MLLLSVSSYSVEEMKNTYTGQCFVTAGVMTEARKRNNTGGKSLFPWAVRRNLPAEVIRSERI